MDSILADVERLGLEYSKPITYTSDYFPQMLDLAERLIRAGTMYADDTPVEQMRAVRGLIASLGSSSCPLPCVASHTRICLWLYKSANRQMHRSCQIIRNANV